MSLAVAYDSECLSLCPVRAVEQYVEIFRALGLDMSSQDIFFRRFPKRIGYR